jgi:hypothetical protein
MQLFSFCSLFSLQMLRLASKKFCFRRSLGRLGHNLEDHYDMAEFQCAMNNPVTEYVAWAGAAMMVMFAVGPLMHSNYYFGGRFFPRAGGDAQMCDDSW